MKFLILAAVMMSMGLASCGWKENPFQGKSQGVQQAEPPDTSEKPQGDDEKALRIDTDDFYSFTEGQDSQYLIKGIVLISKAEFELSIENLADFPDAKFDAATGSFEWAPPEGFITDFSTKRLNLNILIATKGVTPIRIKHKSVPVFVTPSQKIPVIQAITFDQGRSFVREGETLNFDVKVKDITGIDADGSRPDLTFLTTDDDELPASSVVTLRNMGYNVSNPEQSVADNTIWTFHMQIDLSKREVTNSKLRLRFNVVAMSRFGVRSQVSTSFLDIRTSLQTPTVSWTKAQEMKAGEKNSFTFMVFDPRGEGDVQYNLITDCKKIDANLQCGNCTSSIDPTFGKVLYCPVSWNIPADYLTKGGKDQVTLEMQVGARSKISNDNYTAPSKTILGVIKVLPPDPATTPAPNPAPTAGGN